MPTQKLEVYVQCKEFDEVASKGEISTALKEHLEGTVHVEGTCRGVHCEFVLTMTVDAAQKLLRAERVRIGCVVCRQQISLKRCLRCLRFGHFAKA